MTVNKITNAPTQNEIINSINGLIDNKQDTISDLSTIRSNAANGQSAYTTIGGYGDIVTYNASNFVQKNGGSSTQTISLTSGTGTTALGIKSMATSSYISFSGSSGWLGSFGVTSNKRPAFYNGTGYTLAYTSEIPTNTSDLTNDSGYITGINSSDVITALGYTPYNSTNPNGYTSNVGTVTSVNNTQPDANGDVTLTIPTVNDGVLTITQNGTSKGTFSANQSINDTIALTDTTYNAFTGADGTNAGSSGLVPAPSATDNDKYLKGDGTWASVSGGSSTDVQINGTSITSGGVANILTQTAYNATSNKIATMSDLPADEIFVATYGTTTYNEIKTAITNGKIVLAKAYNLYYSLTLNSSTVYAFSYFLSDTCYIVEVTNGNLWSSGSYTYQQTSTAVTHPASTAIGGVDVPVFVNSNGIVTSTGKSIASSRFDGQWVQKNTTLADGVSMGNDTSKTYSLASYLPDATYDYEVMFSGLVITASSSGKFLKMTLGSSVVNNIWVCDARTRTSSSMEATGSCIVPISKNSQQISMKSEASSNSSGTMSLVALAYRRIGTNS